MKSLNFKSLLIVTYGRSGSTLLQGVINHIDGVLVRGENSNFIYGLYESYKRLLETYNNHPNSNHTNHAWYGAEVINIELFLNYCCRMIKDILLADRKQEDIACYGFKEIRYIEVYQKNGEIADYLYFLRQVFPKLCFIFNTRNLDDVLQSGSWSAKKDKEKSRQTLVELEKSFNSYAKNHPDHTFKISYEDVVLQSNKLKSLYEFLGAESPENIDKILSTPHSYSQKHIKAYHNIVFRLAPASTYANLLRFFDLDRVPKEVISGVAFNIGGLAIPANNQISVLAIHIVGLEKTFKAELGLSSPIYGNRYVEIKGSQNARFEFKNIVVSHSLDLRLIVETNNQKNIEIATISIDIKNHKDKKRVHMPALKLSPNSKICVPSIEFIRKGNQLKRLGQLNEAIDAYQKAIELNPRFSWSYYLLCEVFASQDKYDEVLNIYEQLIDLKIDGQAGSNKLPKSIEKVIANAKEKLN